MIQLLLNAGADVSKLIENSAKEGLASSLKSYIQIDPTIQVLQLLIDAGLDLSARDENGDTLLHYRARKGAGEADEFLCKAVKEYGDSHPPADKEQEDDKEDDHSLSDVANSKGETPFMCAAVSANTVIMGALLQLGADINRPPTRRHPSILHWLLLQSPSGYVQEPGVEYLLKQGAATDKVYPGTGRTLLHEASARGRTRVVELLLTKGSMDPNATIPDPSGGDPITPLMLAIGRNDVRTVQLLINNDARVGEAELRAVPSDAHASMHKILSRPKNPSNLGLLQL